MIREVLDEVTPPHFDPQLKKKIKGEYPDEPEKAYGTMWKISNKEECGNMEESIVNYTTKQLEKIKEYSGTTYIVSGYDSSNGSVILTNPADGNTITIDKSGNEKTLGTYKRMN